jgi:hypothetical protein
MTDAVLPYGDPLTIETRSATFEEVCPPASTECGDNPFLTLIPNRDQAGEDSSCRMAMDSAYDNVYALDYPTFAVKWT